MKTHARDSSKGGQKINGEAAGAMVVAGKATGAGLGGAIEVALNQYWSGLAD